MLALALPPVTAQATSFTWTGTAAGAGLWTYNTSPYSWSGASGTDHYPGQTHTTNTDQATINNATSNPARLTSGTITLGGTGVGPVGDLNYALYIGSSAGPDALTLSGSAILGVKGGIYNAQNINLNSSSVLRNDAANGTTHQAIKGNGTITMAGGSIQSANGGIWDLNQALLGYGTISAPVTNNSSITANNATALNITGALTNGATGVLNAGTSTANPTGTLILSNLTNSGAINVYGTLTNNTGAALSLTPINLAGGTLNGAGGYSNAGSWSGYGTIATPLNNSGSITVNAPNTLVLGGALTNTGTFNVNGTLTNNTGSAQNLAAFILTGGTLNGSKGYSNSGTWGGYGSIQSLTGNTGTLNASGGVLALNGNINNLNGTLGSTGGGSFTNNGTISNGTISGNVAMNGGALSATSGTMTLSSTISGAYSVTASGGAQVALNGAHLIGPTAFFNYITLGSSNTSGPINLTGDSEFANNFQVNGYSPINVNGNTLTLTNFKGALPSGTYLNVGTGNLQINGPASVYSGGNVHLAGGNIYGSNVNTLQGNVTGYGDVTAKLLSPAGNLATASGGTLYISGGAEFALPGGTYNNGSLASSNGATLDIRSTISNSQPFTSYVTPNGGTVNLDGATLAAATGAAINLTAGTVNVTNNSTMTGTIGSAANLTVTSGKSLDASGASFTNTGTVFVDHGTASWGTFTNNGAYHSDPSTQVFASLTQGATGYLTGGTGDVFQVKGDFINGSTQNTLWNTALAALDFISNGTSTSHNFALAGADKGAGDGGFLDNFAWGTLDLAGQTLSLSDGNTTPGAALYVDDITGLDISGFTVENIIGNGFNI